MVNALRWMLWVAGGLALIFGLVLWGGNGYAYRNLHMILGVVVVLALWALAIVALLGGTQRGLAVTALVWGLITPVIGVVQVQLLPGGAHIIIQLVHLVMGAGAVALGNRLATGLPQNVLALMGRSPHVRSVESSKDRAITLEALHETKVAEHAGRSYPTLSGGEKGRVQLARALSQIWEEAEGSRYLFLDEPTNNLDLAHQHRALETARRFAEEGVGVLAVLHDLNLAAQYADRVLLLAGGCCVACGPPERVLSAEQIGRLQRAG